MFLICRNTDGPLQIIVRGDCEDFVKHYLKHNIVGRDIGNYKVLKTEEVDINLFIDTNSEVPLEQ